MSARFYWASTSKCAAICLSPWHYNKLVGWEILWCSTTKLWNKCIKINKLSKIMNKTEIQIIITIFPKINTSPNDRAIKKY